MTETAGGKNTLEHDVTSWDQVSISFYQPHVTVTTFNLTFPL